MELDAKIKSLLTGGSSQKRPLPFPSYGRGSASHRVWTHIAEHLTMLKLLEIEATDKELLDWAIQLAQATANERIDLSVDVDFSALRMELADISSELSSIRESIVSRNG